jgi:hypothetical protein
MLVYTSSAISIYIKNEEKLHEFVVMVYVEVWSPLLCSLTGLFFVYSLKMPVPPYVVLLMRNFLLLHFIFPPSVFMLLM